MVTNDGAAAALFSGGGCGSNPRHAHSTRTSRAPVRSLAPPTPGLTGSMVRALERRRGAGVRRGLGSRAALHQDPTRAFAAFTQQRTQNMRTVDCGNTCAGYNHCLRTCTHTQPISVHYSNGSNSEETLQLYNAAQPIHATQTSEWIQSSLYSHYLRVSHELYCRMGKKQRFPTKYWGCACNLCYVQSKRLVAK